MASVLEFLLKLMKSGSIMFSCLLVSIIFWVFFGTLHESCGRENVKKTTASHAVKLLNVSGLLDDYFRGMVIIVRGEGLSLDKVRFDLLLLCASQ